MRLTKKVGIMGCIGAMTIIIFGCSTAGSEFSPEKVIDNALEEPKDVGPYYAEAKLTTVEKGKKAEQVFIKEWYSEEGGVRIEAIKPDGTEQNIMVMDGENLINYRPEEKQAYIIEDNPSMLSQNQVSQRKQAEYLLKNVQDTHHISFSGEEKVAGRATYHLVAKAKENNNLIGDQELWIDKKNWMILKLKSKSGDLSTETRYTKVEFDPKFPEDTFMLNLPHDVEVQDLEEMSQSREVTLTEAKEHIGKPFLLIPEKTPLSISKVEAYDTERKEISVEYQKDGIPAFTQSVLELPEESSEKRERIPGEEPTTVRGQEGTYMEFNEFRSLAWQEGDFQYSILFINPDLKVDEVKKWTEDMETLNR